MRAGIYCRISSDPTGQQAGVSRQDEDCRALCDSLGWTVADVYTDNDLSASTGKRRPAYEHLLADVAAGTLDAIVCWHPDRLYRLTRELERIIDVVADAGAEIRTVTAGHIDLSTVSGRMTARILGATAQGEVEHKAERQRAAIRRAAEEGRLTGKGRRPFGYTPDRSEIVESEAAVIREAADRLLAGESLTAVCRRLNQRGVTTSGGNLWRPGALSSMIASPHLAGLRQHRGEVVAQAVWPAILDEVTHRRLRHLLVDSAQRRPTMRRHLLTGLLVCGRCGAVMYGQHLSDRDRIAYRCMRREGEVNGGCGRNSIDAAIEGWLSRQVAAVLTDRVEAPDADDRRGRLVAAISEADAALADLSRMWAAGELTRGEWQAARDVHRQRMDESERALRDLDAAQGRRRRTGEDPWAVLDGGDLWQRRTLIEAVVESVTILRALPGRNFFDASRVAVTWRA